jgi:hypothetical protein|tara:strand:- start:268 stop:498 length:231 start_codon:yes stop_codon:yes gene_type:complete
MKKFTENKAFNDLTPGDIYTVSKAEKDLINKILKGNLSAFAFVRKDKKGNYQIKPATYGDEKIILQIIEKINELKL